MVPEDQLEDAPVISKKQDVLLAGLSPYYGPWNDLSSSPPACWTKTVSKLLETLPIDVVRDHPALQQLVQYLDPLTGHDDGGFRSNPHDANGSSV